MHSRLIPTLLPMLLFLHAGCEPAQPPAFPPEATDATALPPEPFDASSEAAPPREERPCIPLSEDSAMACADRRDNDCDGLTDCDDSDCRQPAAGDACRMTAPPPACLDGMIRCGGYCANPMNDTRNCGGCAQVCLVAHGSPRCAGGACAVASCERSFADCNGAAPDGCEVDLDTDARHCGACGSVCAPFRAVGACVRGRCTIGRCVPGAGDCDASPTNGCEVDLLASPAHCGACGHACTGGQVCSGGACVCPRGQTWCQGACRDLSTDVAHCGACGRACEAGDACADGRCGAPCGRSVCTVRSDACQACWTSDPARLCCLGTPNPMGGSSSPVRQGPWCCTGRVVVRPETNACEVAPDLSPRIDTHGVYDAATDHPNFLPVTVVAGGAATLEILAIWVRDNGEGDDWPHGPHGNLHYDLFPPSEPLARSYDGADGRRLDADRILRGPHRTHDDTDEWLDDEALTYRDAGLFVWAASGDLRDRVILRVYESDSNSEDGNWLGRRNDVMGMEIISRVETATPCGVWVAFHKYTNDHPRVRTSEISMWMLLRTR